MYENDYLYAVERDGAYLAHYGIKGMKWGVRKARERGNDRALGRQYRKAAKKLAKLEKRGQRQAAALMASAELLMTGKTRAAEGEVPFAYEVGGWSASVERFDFTGDPDRGSLTNYRLKK